MSFISFDFFCPCTTEYVAPKGTRIINIIVGVFFAPGFVLKNKTKKLLRKHKTFYVRLWNFFLYFLISWMMKIIFGPSNYFTTWNENFHADEINK